MRIPRASAEGVRQLDRMGLVCPQKIGDSKKPVVLYTADQIELIRLIDQAAEYLHTQGLRLALQSGQLPSLVQALHELSLIK